MALQMETLSAHATAALLAEGSSAEEREAQYASVEQQLRLISVNRGLLPSTTKSSSSRSRSTESPAAVSGVVAFVKPLVERVLCAPACRVGRKEWERAALLLHEMQKVCLLEVSAELWRPNSEGDMLYMSTWKKRTPGTVLDVMLEKEPHGWTPDDAVIAALNLAPTESMYAQGATEVFLAAGHEDDEEFIEEWFAHCPYLPGQMAEGGRWAGQPRERFTPLALLCLDLVRTDIDTQPEGVIAGAWAGTMMEGQPLVAKALWEAGFLDVVQTVIKRWNPLERIDRRNLIASNMLGAFKSIVDHAQQAGVDVMPALLSTEVVDIPISSLVAYKFMRKPEEASVNAIQWGALHLLEDLHLDTPQAKPVVDKLRNAGVDAFRYALDHPLVAMKDIGLVRTPRPRYCNGNSLTPLMQDTTVHATRIAAVVWGRDEGCGGIVFTQQNIDA
eukprot:COSAG01_NODE_2019_length_8634_cov_14.764499_7_plen_445_part_00